MKALSIRQPWASLIVYGGKNIENRTWSTSYRGLVLIHASKTHDRQAYERYGPEIQLALPAFAFGGIIGIADLVDCVTESDSDWFTGPYGFVLENARPLPFRAVRGNLGLFDVDWPEAIEL